MLSRTSLGTAEEFANIMLKSAGGLQVKLGDVARVELGTADVRRESRYNGETAISIGVVKQAVANPLDVSNAIKASPAAGQSVDARRGWSRASATTRRCSSTGRSATCS